MKYAITFALLAAFAQYVVVPSFESGSAAAVKNAVESRNAMLEELSK